MDTNINEIEILLDKLNLLFESMKRDGRIEKVEVELLKKYTRQLGSKLDAIHPEEFFSPTYREQPHAEIKKPEIQKESPEEEPVLKPEMEIADTGILDEAIISVETAASEIIENPVVDEKPVPEPPVFKQPEAEKKTIKKPLVGGHEDEESEENYNSGLHKKINADKKTLAEKILTHKAKDLKSVIHLNDKLFFVKELFKGNSKEYDHVINTLNGMQNFGDCKKFIRTDLTAQYQWEDDDAVERLLEVVQLKFEK